MSLKSRNYSVIHSKHSHSCVHFQKLAHALTIKDLDDVLADEVLDFIVIDYSLFKNREKEQKNKRANINQGR